ncbi:MAG: hypothetical protein ACR2HR_00415 [Euzebya sp.]
MMMAPHQPKDPRVEDDAPGGFVLVGLAGLTRTWLMVTVLILVLAEVTVRVATAATVPPLRYYDHAAQLRVQMMQQRGPVDVVFAGTSMAWQDLVPATFQDVDPAGRSAFNVGLNGAVPVVTGPWLRDQVVPRLRPRTVVWGLSSLDFAPAYGQQQLSAWTTSPEGRPGPLGAVERWAADWSAVVARRPQLRRPSNLTGTTAVQTERDRVAAQALTGPDGQRIDFATTRDDQRAAVQVARLAGYGPDPADIRAVVDTVLALQAEGTEVVLAELPASPSFIALHPHASQDTGLARTIMAALADELAIRFIPASTQWTDADFVDYTHLGARGAERFTTELSNALSTALTQQMDEESPADSGPADIAGAGVSSAYPIPPAPSPSSGSTQPSPTPPAPASAATSAVPAGTSGATNPIGTGTSAAPQPQVTTSAGGPTTTGQPSDNPAQATTPTGGALATGDWLGSPAALATAEVLRLAAVTQLGCGGHALPPELDARARQGAAELADTDIAAAVNDTLDRAVDLSRSCGDEAAWRVALYSALQSTEGLVRLLEGATAVPETPQGAVAQSAQNASSRDLAVFAADAHDRLHWLLSGAGHPRLARNPVWWSYAQRGHVDALLRATEAGQRFDTVVFGTSQARTGIVADRLSQATGRTVFNAGIDGGTVDIAEVWARRFVLDLVQPARALVMVSGVDVLTSVGPPCPSTGLAGFTASMDVAGASFTPVPWLSASPMRLASASDPTVASPLRSPLRDGYVAGPEEDYRQRTREQVMQRGRSYLAAYESFTYCPDRFDALERLVGEMTTRGIEVVVVAAPIRSELRDIAPSGTVENLDRQLAQITERAGGRLISYTGVMADADMVDLVHVSQPGALALTDRLAADLERP